MMRAPGVKPDSHHLGRLRRRPKPVSGFDPWPRFIGILGAPFCPAVVDRLHSSGKKGTFLLRLDTRNPTRAVWDENRSIRHFEGSPRGELRSQSAELRCPLRGDLVHEPVFDNNDDQPAIAASPEVCPLSVPLLAVRELASASPCDPALLCAPQTASASTLAPFLWAVRLSNPIAGPFRFGSLQTALELAERLQVSLGTLRTWRSEGKEPRFHRIGQLIRYAPSDSLCTEVTCVVCGGSKSRQHPRTTAHAALCSMRDARPPVSNEPGAHSARGRTWVL